MDHPIKISTITCIGAGFVGGPSMAIIALKCPDIIVTVVDKDANKIAAWNTDNLDELPVYEPGLKEIIAQTRGKNLFFSTDIPLAIEQAQMIFMAVNTPTKSYGKGKGMAADLKYVERCARQIGEVATTDKIVVEKSTLPVRTAETIRSILDNVGSGVAFQILSNPEFLAEGTAMSDLEYADRVLIGGDYKTAQGRAAMDALTNIYTNWIPREKILQTNVWSSELSKLTSNAFLAQRISSINAISELCEKTGADIREVAGAIGMDRRIGKYFLNASVGFGGSCFQKDILNLVYIAAGLNLHQVADYWSQVIVMNNHQKGRFADKIIKTLYNTVSEKKISFLGWAFKKDTNDSRESAAMYVAYKLMEDEAEIHVYDPKVTESQMINDLKYVASISGESEDVITEKISRLLFVYSDPYLAMEQAHAVAILTEWDAFLSLNWLEIYKQMKKPAFIFDGRNLLDKEKIKEMGFYYYGIGRE